VIDGGKKEERKRDNRFRNVGKGRVKKIGIKGQGSEYLSMYLCHCVPTWKRNRSGA